MRCSPFQAILGGAFSFQRLGLTPLGKAGRSRAPILTSLHVASRWALQGVHPCVNLRLPAPEEEAAMDEAGMSEADKREFVEDVLLTWGEEAAQEVAERYGVDLLALKPEHGGMGPPSRP